MPRYFFDVWDGEGVFVDELGVELSDMNTAIAEARRALSDMVRDVLREQGADCLSIKVRQEAEGPVVLTVTLTTVGPAGQIS